MAPRGEKTLPGPGASGGPSRLSPFGSPWTLRLASEQVAVAARGPEAGPLLMPTLSLLSPGAGAPSSSLPPVMLQTQPTDLELGVLTRQVGRGEGIERGAGPAAHCLPLGFSMAGDGQ